MFLKQEIGSLKNAESLYVEKGYGGHFNKKGNYLIKFYVDTEYLVNSDRKSK